MKPDKDEQIRTLELKVARLEGIIEGLSRRSVYSPGYWYNGLIGQGDITYINGLTECTTTVVGSALTGGFSGVT